MVHPSIEYAIYALICIGTADAVNKRARLAGIPVSTYLLVQSPFFLCLVLVIALFTTGIRFSRADIIHSIIVAVFSFAAFTLMLHSLGKGYASINYAIFRLSFVFSSALALVIFNEVFTYNKVIGIVVAAAALFVFFKETGSGTTFKKAFMFAVAAMICNVLYQLSLKFATTVYTASPSFLLSTSFFFSLLVIGYNLFNRKLSIPKITLLYAPLNGILSALGALFMLIALSQGEVGFVFPLIHMSFIVTFVISISFLAEKPSKMQILGVIVAAIAIIVLIG
ncbi:MAG: DMT family transporter [candidate division WOR-3 bacterium]|nr:MAG: DMT family transporter [candidate division WOR-3 bacterium]